MVSIADTGKAHAPDGYWWTTLTNAQQLYVVMGAIDAYHNGIVNGSYSTAQLLGRNSAPESVRARSLFTHTLGFYVAAITDFYDVHPNAKAATIGEVLSCLADRPDMPCAKVAELVGR
jgi:hypothetical protein